MAMRWVNVVLGAWLLVVGILSGPGSPAFPDHVALGLLVFLVAFLGMALPRIRILNVALGGFTALSPFLFHFHRAPIGLNDIVVGLLVIAAALTPTRPARRATLAA
jgi:hypothetical protein